MNAGHNGVGRRRRCLVLGRTYDRENCSAARALEIVGERDMLSLRLRKVSE